MRHRELAALVASCLLVVGCGGGDTPPAPEAVGAGLSDTVATGSPPPTGIVAAPSPPSTPPPPVANRTDRDLEGWALSLVVADKSTFRSDEPIVFELTFVNAADDTQYTDAAQDLHFGIIDDAGQFVWTDQSCGGARSEVPGESHAALGFAPGESGRFVGRYPVPATSDRSSAEGCRLPPGRYAVVGQLDWCPPAALDEVSYREKRSYVCDPDGVRPLLSEPAAVEITA